jgi:hypothetical protein
MDFLPVVSPKNVMGNFDPIVSQNLVSRQLAEPLVRADYTAKCSRSMLDERIGDLPLIEKP